MGRTVGRWTARWAARALVLGLVAGLAVLLWRRFGTGPSADDAAAPATPPEWPPFEHIPPLVDPAPTWRPAVDGACPEGYPIKVNERSGIYHVPGGRFYDRTRPDRCYAEAAGAEADGYRRAKA